jgi:phenylpyruvate tautomerase PptA (4-oxalocrotonate tautomerase family)
MPVVNVTLLPGYGSEVESRLVQRLARTVRSVIAAPQAGTTVFVQHASTYQRDGRVFAGGNAALLDASGLIRQFLSLMQERRLVDAEKLLAPNFVMRFPGAAPMHRLAELVEWSKPRYQRITKTYQAFDESWGDEYTVVHCHGSLQGIWLDGSTFDGIRFIDRFEVVGGLIQRQDVWNDLAETKQALSAK